MPFLLTFPAPSRLLWHRRALQHSVQAGVRVGAQCAHDKVSPTAYPARTPDNRVAGVHQPNVSLYPGNYCFLRHWSFLGIKHRRILCWGSGAKAQSRLALRTLCFVEAAQSAKVILIMELVAFHTTDQGTAVSYRRDRNVVDALARIELHKRGRNYVGKGIDPQFRTPLLDVVSRMILRLERDPSATQTAGWAEGRIQTEACEDSTAYCMGLWEG